MEFENDDKNEIKPENKGLNIRQFELDLNKNRATQALFHYVLDSLIIKYNKMGEEKCKIEGIYYLKDKHLLLANLTEELVQGFYKYQDLYNGLMAGQSRFFPEYDKELDKRSHKNFLNNYNDKIYPCISCKSDTKIFANNLSINGLKLPKSTISDNKINYDDAKIEYNLNKFSKYFNGMYFESVATEIFFDLINYNYNDINNNKTAISFLPRIIFYMKKEGQKDELNDHHGYNEIDCAFIYKKKRNAFIRKELITCFKSFEAKHLSSFYNDDNFLDHLTIRKNNVVILEFKSTWINLTNPKKGNENKRINKEEPKDKKFENSLETFVKKAKRFINLYIELKLIEKNQNILLLYVYNNSMRYNFEEDNEEIKKVYSKLKNDANIKLFIAFFQPYMKLINSYERLEKMRKLNKDIMDQKEKIDKQHKELFDQKKEIQNQNDKIINQDKVIQGQNEKIINQNKVIQGQNEKIINLENESKQQKEKINRQEKELAEQKTKNKKFEQKFEDQEKNFKQNIESLKSFFELKIKQLKDEMNKEKEQSTKKDNDSNNSNSAKSSKNKENYGEKSNEDKKNEREKKNSISSGGGTKASDNTSGNDN